MNSDHFYWGWFLFLLVSKPDESTKTNRKSQEPISVFFVARIDEENVFRNL